IQVIAVVGGEDDPSACDLGRWFQESGDAVGKRRLPTTALTGKAEDLAALQSERHLSYGVHGGLGQVVDRQVLDAEDTHACTLHLLRSARVCERSFGLMISSMEKLISESAAPKSAIARPGGANHHQAPRRSASPFCA